MPEGPDTERLNGVPVLRNINVVHTRSCLLFCVIGIFWPDVPIRLGNRIFRDYLDMLIS